MSARLHPELMEEYVELKPRYEALGGEVRYILETVLRKQGIEISAILHRTKTIASIVEKLERKGYESGLDSITDWCGVRVVHLYGSDQAHIEAALHENFDIIERADKVESQGDDRFGYAAVHYLARLGGKHRGARYDELKALICEIQVRTVLQDAWAVVSHHLQYKQEASVPRRLRRQIHAIAGALELADSHLDVLRARRTEYAEELMAKSDEDWLSQEIDTDSLSEFLRRRFPHARLEISRYFLADFPADLKKNGYDTIEDVAELLRRTEVARRKFMERESFGHSAARELFVALGLVAPSYRRAFAREEDRELLEEVESWVTS